MCCRSNDYGRIFLEINCFLLLEISFQIKIAISTFNRLLGVYDWLERIFNSYLKVFTFKYLCSKISR